MIADLDTLLIALYVELTDRIIASLGNGERRVGRPPEVTDAELVCLAVAQVLLRYDDERHWLRAAPARVGHLFPRLLSQSEYNERLKNAAPLMEAALRWLADQTPGSAEMLRLMDGTPVPCGQSVVTAKRSGLAGDRVRLLRVPFPLLLGRQADAHRDARRHHHRVLPGQPQADRRPGPGQRNAQTPARQPHPGTVIVTDKGFAGEDFEDFLTSPQLGLTLIRPARKDEKQSRCFPNWLRQRVEAIIWTIKNQLGLERHGGRVPAGLWARVVQRLLALNVAIWHNWRIGAPVKRSLIAYDH